MRVFLLITLLLTFEAAKSLKFENEGILKLVNAHNKHRSDLARGALSFKGVAKPAAGNMLKLEWSLKLAKYAQKFADSCPSNHSEGRSLGENLYWHFTNQFNDLNEYGQLASESWFKEFETYGWEGLKYASSSQRQTIGHAVQMVWSKTAKVGCGIAKCEEGGANPNVFVVCRYHPKGNIDTEPIYDEGPACSHCPASYDKCEYGLCNR